MTLHPDGAQGAGTAGDLAGPAGDEVALIGRLRAGDAAAFEEIVTAWSPLMLRVARAHVSTGASAEEVVQEAWLGMIKGLDRFEGRSALRTWVLRILVNIAKTRGAREARTVPWSAINENRGENEGENRGENGGPTVDPARFRGAGDAWAGHWTPGGEPRAWEPLPEDAVLSAEVRALLVAALDTLPERQRAVVGLRDVHGLSAGEVCDLLGLTPANQRVLLHRGRARVRAVLERRYQETGEVRS
jgi:RNA polymerase sigma-70 factor, ECF subfamily